MKKVLLVAGDVNPSVALSRVQMELGKRPNCETKGHFGHGKPLCMSEDDFRSAVSECNVVIVGMSSLGDHAKEEIAAAAEAISAGKKLCLFSDNHGCYQRQWFSQFREKAAALFVVTEPEAVAARSLFPNSLIVPSGNPVWDDFVKLSMPRQDVRTKLGVRADEKLILVPFGKSAPRNVELLAHVAGAVEDLTDDDFESPLRLAVSLHPGDPNDISAYKCAVRDQALVDFVEKSRMATSDIIWGANLVVSSHSPTTDYHAAFLQLPLINFLTVSGMERTERETGDPLPVLVRLGAAYPVCRSADLPNAIGCLLENNMLSTAQKAAFPHMPVPGVAARMIADTLVSL